MTYRASAIKTYMEAKINILTSRGSEFTSVFTPEELEKEIHIAKSTIELCDIIEALQKIANNDELKAAVSLLELA